MPRYLYGFNEPRSTLLVCSSSIFYLLSGLWLDWGLARMSSLLAALRPPRPPRQPTWTWQQHTGCPVITARSEPFVLNSTPRMKIDGMRKNVHGKNKCSDRSVRKLWQTDRQAQGTFKDQPTNRRTWELIGKLHFQNTFIYISHDWIDINRVFGK